MTRVAAVDCGTNTIRLLITDLDPSSGEQRDVERRSEIVRLGQGVDRSGAFAPDAVARTLAMADGYAAAIVATGATSTRVVGTSAARDASNGGAFSAAMHERFGVAFEILGGDDEAELTLAGVTRAIRGDDNLVSPSLIVDIGGGSTEVISAGRFGPRVKGQGVSLDIGSVRLTERTLHSDPPAPAEIADTRATVARALATLPDPIGGTRTLVGVAGTVTTVAAMALGLDRHDPALLHRAYVEAAAVEEAVDALVAMTVAERRQMPYMRAGRADVIAAGALILAVIMRESGARGLLVSTRDILDGIAWSQLDGSGQ